MFASRGSFVPSHCLYTNDSLSFDKGSLFNVRNIMKLFEDDGEYSWKLINGSKIKLEG